MSIDSYIPGSPWISVEYAKELDKQRKLEMTENPWTEERSKAAIAAAGEEGKRQGDEMRARRKEIGEIAYIKECIKKSKENIERHKNPSVEEKYMRTAAYFSDMIAALTRSIESFELMLKIKEDPTLTDPAFPKIPATKYPKAFIYPKDKVSNLLFIGEFNDDSTPLKMEGNGSKRELTAKVSIDFDELKNISISKDLSPYDREVHDSIVSLFVDGGNEYITPLMVYRTMTGNPKAKLLPKQQESILESITRCSFTRIRIDVTSEAKAYKNMDKAVYEGNLLYTEKITVNHLGKRSEWIHVLREPVLYDYASSKNQIGRLDIKLLDTPVNKNEEIIILQGYLQRRILTMKGSSISRNIVYETIYKKLNISSESSVADRKKEKKIRDFIEVILNYWKEQGFILDFIKNGTKTLSIEF